MSSRFSQKNVAAALAVGLLLVGAGEAAWACPSCQAALAAHDPQSANLARGYFYSILFMIGMPFTMLTIFSVSMYRAVKKAERGRDLSQPRGETEVNIPGVLQAPPPV